MGYVIYLASQSDFEERWRNAYGYWSGKNYTHNHELFPVCDSEVTERTKIYTTKARAEKGLEACFNKGYAYVCNGFVEKYDVIPKEKYAIYKTKVGLYSLLYIDRLKDCENLLGGHLIKANDLPIVVNRAGGRMSFSSVEGDFVEIIVVNEGEEPLTREQRYPKNSNAFEYGWISPEGDTYNTGYEGHYWAAECICNELGISSYNAESELEKRKWVKITAHYSDGELVKDVFAQDFFITKKQTDTLFDLGLYDNRYVQLYIEHSENSW